MPESLCVVPSVWRHICPTIRDVAVSVKLPTKTWIVDIPRDLRIQGAKVPNTILLAEFKLQGAFQCEHVIHTNPKKGTLEFWSTGWVYKPGVNAAIGGSDSFQFRLLLNGESSLPALMKLNFI